MPTPHVAETMTSLHCSEGFEGACDGFPALPAFAFGGSDYAGHAFCVVHLQEAVRAGTARIILRTEDTEETTNQ